MSYFDTEEDLKHGDSAKCCEWGLRVFLDIYLALIIIYLESVSQSVSKIIRIMSAFRFN